LEDPWYTITDSFDTDFGVTEWHGHNAFIRDGDKVFPHNLINSRGEEAMGTTGAPDKTRLASGDVGDSPEGYPQTPTYQVVELARQYGAESSTPPKVVEVSDEGDGRLPKNGVQ